MFQTNTNINCFTDQFNRTRFLNAAPGYWRRRSYAILKTHLSSSPFGIVTAVPHTFWQIAWSNRSGLTATTRALWNLNFEWESITLPNTATRLYNTDKLQKFLPLMPYTRNLRRREWLWLVLNSSLNLDNGFVVYPRVLGLEPSTQCNWVKNFVIHKRRGLSGQY